MNYFFAILFYAATAILLAGLFVKIRQYWRTPAPLKIPTTPAPVTQTGVVIRMFLEVTIFKSLFKSNKWIWVLGILFHFGLLLVLLRHFRYFQSDVNTLIVLLQPIGKYASLAMVAGLAGLLFRRFAVARVRYISAPSDYLMLILLLGIGFTGIAMSFIGNLDIVSIKAYFLGLMTFNIQPLPTEHPALLIHLFLVAFLMIIFPFSKLLHAPGVFFSPTRNQVDNPREKRHIADWARKYDDNRD
jgi:nitrate reductase gamma subunit